LRKVIRLQDSEWQKPVLWEKRVTKPPLSVILLIMNKTRRMAVLEHRHKAKKAKLKRQAAAPVKTAAPAARAKK